MQKISRLLLGILFCLITLPLTSYSQTGKWGGDLPTAEDILNTYGTLQHEPLSDDVCPAHVRRQGAEILVQLSVENPEISDNTGKKQKFSEILKKVSTKDLEKLRLKSTRDMAIVYTELIRNPNRMYRYPVQCENLHGELLTPAYGSRAFSFNPLELKNALEAAEHLEWLFQDERNKSAFLNPPIQAWSNKPLIMDETELRESVKRQAKEIISQIRKDSKGDELINTPGLSVYTLQTVLTTFWVPPGEIDLSLEQARKIVREGDFSALVVTKTIKN